MMYVGFLTPVVSYSFDGSVNGQMTFTPPLMTQLGVVGHAMDLSNLQNDIVTLGISVFEFTSLCNKRFCHEKSTYHMPTRHGCNYNCHQS